MSAEPEEIPQGSGFDFACGLARRWMIHLTLAERLVALAQRVPFRISIISGFRSEAQQKELAERGRPATAVSLSTHTTCPATGADLKIGVGFVTNAHKLALGEAATSAGLRWGGGSHPDDHGIPSDWNHVDLGPRMDPEAQAYRASF